MTGHRIGAIIGGVVVVPTSLLLAIGLAAPISGWGIAFLLGLLVAALGMLLTKRRRLLTRVGATVLVTVLVMRCAVVHGDDPSVAIRMVTLGPDGEKSTRSLDKVVPERDLAMGGTRLLATQGTVPRSFPTTLRTAYDHMDRELGPVPSALMATYLGLQRPESFDTLVVTPKNTPPGECRPKTAVVFLHGYAGNVTLLCWTVARAVQDAGITTYCPSVGFEGDWWTEDGARTLGATLDQAKREGHRRVFLAGLSNGARGASLLAPRFRRRIAGLVLISGLSTRAPRPGVPLLLVHGRSDPATPPVATRGYVRRAGPTARQVSMPGDHFVLLTREQRVRAAIARWITRRSPGCR